MPCLDNHDCRETFLAGFECATHRRPDGQRLDLIASTQHDKFAAQDYLSVQRHGLTAARDGLRWHLIEQTPGVYDWSSWRPMLDAAQRSGMPVFWDLWHFGSPDHIDMFDDDLAHRFTDFVRAAASVFAQHCDTLPRWCVMNEISFFSFAAGERGFFPPHRIGEGSVLKRNLARAAIAGAKHLRAANPQCRLLWPEPLIEIAASGDSQEARDKARGGTDVRHEVWDMIAGRVAPDLGGMPALLDIVGCNYYADNQWYDDGATIPMGHFNYKSLSAILSVVYDRYRRPVMVSETGAEASGRASWLHYVCQEVRAAREQGADITGICLYPVTDYPGWDNDRMCHTGFLGFADSAGVRPVNAELASEIARQRTEFASPDAGA